MFLQDAQEFYLRLQEQFPDFIEEDSAAVGEFEASDPPLDRTGEGSFEVAEEFAFRERSLSEGKMRAQ
jgi:hypothetical protein